MISFGIISKEMPKRMLFSLLKKLQYEVNNEFYENVA